MSQTGSVRKRKDKESAPAKAKDVIAAVNAPRDPELDALLKASSPRSVARTGPEWDFRIALSIITFLAFLTRFWGISHPNEVVFDEVHFGKVLIQSTFEIRRKLIPLHSLPPTTLSEPISSMYTLLLESFYSPLWAGLWDTMETSTSRTLATPISQTRFHM